MGWRGRAVLAGGVCVSVVFPVAGCGTSAARHAAVAPRSAAASVSARDWAAVKLPLDCSGLKTVVDATTVLSVPGEAARDTVVLAHCDAAGSPPFAAYLFSGEPGASTSPRLVSTLLRDSEDVAAVKMTAAPGGVKLQGRTWSSTVPRCCPDEWSEWDYRWAGATLRLQAHRVGSLKAKAA